jgi:hypothetical protein
VGTVDTTGVVVVEQGNHHIDLGQRVPSLAPRAIVDLPAEALRQRPPNSIAVNKSPAAAPWPTSVTAKTTRKGGEESAKSVCKVKANS